MSHRGHAECLRWAAEVNTILIGNLRISLANIANCISEFLLTCHILKGLFGGCFLEREIALRLFKGDGHPLRGLPTRATSSWDF